MKTRICALFLMFCLPAMAAASVIPPIGQDANWYIHVNLDQMRQTPSGQALYGWFEKEVIEDLEDEFGSGLGEQLEGVTVFGQSAGHAGLAVLLHGDLVPQTSTNILDVLADLAVPEQAHGLEYFRMPPRFDFGKDGSGGKEADTETSPEYDEESGMFLAFGGDGQTLVTGSRVLLDEFLLAGGRFSGDRPGELLVIQAERPLLQSGLDAAADDLGDGPWESEMFRNIQQLALVLADSGGLLEIRGRIVAADTNKALAIANIIRGMISLGVMAEDEPELMELLGALSVETMESLVDLHLRVEAGRVVEFLD